ncbi:MAG TPA: acyl-CoA dehydrogenase family protein [Acidimicrobiales bacterium]
MGAVPRRRVFDDEHEEFRAAVSGLLKRILDKDHARYREQHHIDRSFWLTLGEHGFLGFMVPERYGGAGIDDFRFNAVLGEELAAHGMALASSIGIHTDVVAPYLLELTTEEQKERWLPRYCTGELVTAIGMTEPGAGSDLARITTSAVPDGDGWVLNGQKTFITNGASADLVVVAARTTPGTSARGITLFGVEAGTDGFERGKPLDKLGQPEADTAELFFTDVRVTRDDVIGEVDRGFYHMMERLPRERLSAAIANLAHATAIANETLEYVKDRHAFGQPIGTFQHNKFTMADVFTKLDVAHAYVDSVLAACAEGNLDPVDAAKAKLVSSEVQNEVLDACLQLHGGYGYMRESAVGRAWADARVTRIWAGSNEIMREIIGRSLGL